MDGLVGIFIGVRIDIRADRWEFDCNEEREEEMLNPGPGVGLCDVTREDAQEMLLEVSSLETLFVLPCCAKHNMLMDCFRTT